MGAADVQAIEESACADSLFVTTMCALVVACFPLHFAGIKQTAESCDQSHDELHGKTAADMAPITLVILRS